MGRAVVHEHIGEGLYEVDVEFNNDRVNLRLMQIAAEILRIQNTDLPRLRAEEAELVATLDAVELSNSILIDAFNAGELQNPTTPSVEQTAFLGLINTERSAASVPTLTFNSTLRNTGQIIAGFNANDNTLRMRGPNGETPSSIARGLGYVPPAVIAEVVGLSAGACRNTQECVDTWMRSIFTSAILLDPEWTDWGFGFVVTDLAYKFYWVNIFGKR